MEGRRCPQCGASCEERDRFCRMCGTPLIADTALSRLAAEYQRKLADKPNDPDLRYNLALAYRKMGLLVPARDELLKVIGLAPDFPEAYSDLVEVLCGLGDIEGAKRVLKEALVKFPADERLRETGGRIEEPPIPLG